LEQKGLNPVIDVEDLSLVNMQLDNGVLAAYQQCLYSPDNWRNFTVIGTRGRIENLGDRTSQTVIRLWNRRQDYNPEGDETWTVPTVEETEVHHDEEIVSEFLRYVSRGGPLTLSPLDARYSVAAGYQATVSLRNGGVPLDVPPLADKFIRYFSGGQQHSCC
jgi:predicted dehydrogenase